MTSQHTLHNPQREHIAYFSMETGISHSIPTYSGGLGILAGDTLKSFADLGYPLVAVTMLNEKGYFNQRIDSQGNQIEEEVNWNPQDIMQALDTTIIVHIEGREVHVRTWKHVITGNSGKNIAIFYLDTNIEPNSEYDKTITKYLYGGDRHYRLCQEIVLGIGGVRMLEALGYSNIRKYHMNEGHAALLGVELAKRTCTGEPHDKNCYDLEDVREKCVFTTHTPVAAGHDRFEVDLVRGVLHDYIPEFILNEATDEGGKFNMTLLGLNSSKSINGVAKKHGEVTRGMFPNFHICSITNGVHTHTWASEPFRELYEKYIPGWDLDPFTLRYAMSIPKDEIWNAHMKAKEELVNTVKSMTGIEFDKNRFTIGFGRRFTAYKRPDLIVQDINRLKTLAQSVGDIQIVYAGKAHKNDGHGKDIIKHIFKIAQEINGENGNIKIAFLEHYDMTLGRVMTSGCDVWLNNPQRPYEASGTSGMKAAINGVPQVSTLDGWWLEGHIEGITGWSIGPHEKDEDFNHDESPDDEAQDLYSKLQYVIIPLYYGNRDAWTTIMRYCIAINGSFFNTYRMVQQYIASAYVSD